MVTKNEIKYIQSLFHKKTRDEHGLFIMEGVKIISELLQSDFIIEKIYALESYTQQHQQIKNIVTVQPYELEKISSLTTPHQALAIVRQKKINSEPVVKNNITLVLDEIQDPGNMGTILRIADWFGVQQIIASENSVDIYNPKTVQSSMGSVLRVNVWYKDLAEWLPTANIPVYGAMLHGKNLYEMSAIKEAVLVIGNESQGIHQNIAKHIHHAVTIPKKGKAESLNAAVATGIILSHLVG